MVEVVLEFTGDPAIIRKTVADMIEAGGLGTTNLYKGYMEGISTAEGRDVAAELVERAVVLITDGTHQAGNEELLRSQALDRKYGSNIDIFTIGIDGDYNKERVRELASRPEYFYETSVDGLSSEFQKIAAGIVELARRNYVVGICTPVDIGSPSLTLNVTKGELFASETVTYSTSGLDGNTTGCDPDQVSRETRNVMPIVQGTAPRAVQETETSVEGRSSSFSSVDTSPRSSSETEHETERYRPGRRFRDCEACPEMVVIPAGDYLMGSPHSEDGRDSDEGPQHLVTISEPLAVGVYEVTFDEWEACERGGGCAVRGYRPNDEPGWGRGARPVIFVQWEDAQAYVLWLREETEGTVSPIERGRVGVCSAGGDADTVSHREDDLGATGEHPRKSYAAGGNFQPKRVWAIRRARKCVGMGPGLL